MNKTTIDENEVAKFKALSKSWWDKDGELKTLHDINPARLAFIEKFTPLRNKRILDVGCGGGILSESMAKKGGLVTGLDVEESSIEIAKQHALESSIKIHYILQNIETFEDKPFDVITSMEMLEHVSNPELVIENCARLLKPGGLLFLSTINRTLQAYLLIILAAEYLFNIIPKKTHEYAKFIKPSELATVIRQNGLEVLELKGLNYNPLSRQASLNDSVNMNYLMVCRKIS